MVTNDVNANDPTHDIVDQKSQLESIDIKESSDTHADETSTGNYQAKTKIKRKPKMKAKAKVKAKTKPNAPRGTEAAVKGSSQQSSKPLSRGSVDSTETFDTTPTPSGPPPSTPMRPSTPSISAASPSASASADRLFRGERAAPRRPSIQTLEPGSAGGPRRKILEPINALEVLAEFLGDDDHESKLQEPDWAPKWQHSASEEEVRAFIEKYDSEHYLSTELLPEATAILDAVLARYGSYERYSTAVHGDVISQDEANKRVCEFLEDNGVADKIKVRWSAELNTGGKVRTTGTLHQPESRQHTLYISTRAKTVLTTRGIEMFAAHEVGTHLMRALNDAHQVWGVDSSRASWSVGRLGTRRSLATEEGLATLHTALHQGQRRKPRARVRGSKSSNQIARNVAVHKSNVETCVSSSLPSSPSHLCCNTPVAAGGDGAVDLSWSVASSNIAEANGDKSTGGTACCDGYLWNAALLYVVAAKAKSLNFRQLFDFLERYIPCPRKRFAYLVRVKGGCTNNSQPGGSGKTQGYFEGAVAILRTLDRCMAAEEGHDVSCEIAQATKAAAAAEAAARLRQQNRPSTSTGSDSSKISTQRRVQTPQKDSFSLRAAPAAKAPQVLGTLGSHQLVRLLFCGKITLEDIAVPRVRRNARLDVLNLPQFVSSGVSSYCSALREIGYLNGLIQRRPALSKRWATVLPSPAVASPGHSFSKPRVRKCTPLKQDVSTQSDVETRLQPAPIMFHPAEAESDSGQSMKLPTLSPSPDRSSPPSEASSNPEHGPVRPGRRTKRVASVRAGPVTLDTWVPRREGKIEDAKAPKKARLVDNAAIAQLAKPKVDSKTLPKPVTKSQAPTKVVDTQALAMLAKPKCRTQAPSRVEEMANTKTQLKLKKRKRRSTSKARERLLAAAAAAKVSSTSDEQSLQCVKGSDKSSDAPGLHTTNEQCSAEGSSGSFGIERAKQTQQVQQLQQMRRSHPQPKQGRPQVPQKKRAEVHVPAPRDLKRHQNLVQKQMESRSLAHGGTTSAKLARCDLDIAHRMEAPAIHDRPDDSEFNNGKSTASNDDDAENKSSLHRHGSKEISLGACAHAGTQRSLNQGVSYIPHAETHLYRLPPSSSYNMVHLAHRQRQNPCSGRILHGAVGTRWQDAHEVHNLVRCTHSGGLHRQNEARQPQNHVLGNSQNPEKHSRPGLQVCGVSLM